MQIPFDRSLSGHSDADVLTHAVIDAMLGAIGEGDIGTHYPDSDPRFEGLSSLVMLQEVMGILGSRGYGLVNVDTVLICEEPKLKPYVGRIKEALAKTLGVSGDRVGIKATTTEGMGFTGRGEGIAAYAVVLLESLGEVDE